MNIKMYVGGAATVAVAVFTWGSNLNSEVSVNTSQINDLKIAVVELREQYSEYDRQLTELIHKQDTRITLLENLIEVNSQKNNKEL